MAYKDYQHLHARYPSRYISELLDNDGQAPEYPTDPELDVRAVPDYLVDRAPSEGALPEEPIIGIATLTIGNDGTYWGFLDNPGTPYGALVPVNGSNFGLNADDPYLVALRCNGSFMTVQLSAAPSDGSWIRLNDFSINGDRTWTPDVLPFENVSSPAVCSWEPSHCANWTDGDNPFQTLGDGATCDIILELENFPDPR